MRSSTRPIAIPREVLFNEKPFEEIGYVEAVCAHPEFQGQGIGTQLMRKLHGDIDSRWDIAMLSTGRSTAFYSALGWKQWQGLSKTQTVTHTYLDNEHGSLMIRGSRIPELSHWTTSVACRDRAGDAW